jgi:hypothetical protein
MNKIASLVWAPHMFVYPVKAARQPPPKAGRRRRRKTVAMSDR